MGAKILGAGLLAAFVGAWANVSARELQSAVGPNASQASFASVNERVHDRQVVGFVGLGFGVLATVAGTTLILWPESLALSPCVTSPAGR